jgi:hypothetical protein
MIGKLIEKQNLTISERETVSLLPNNRRYDFFVKRVVRTGAIWVLSSTEEWFTLEGGNGYQLFPMWTDSEFAMDFQTAIKMNSSNSLTVEKLPLSQWIEEIAPKLAEYGDRPWVFPLANLEGGTASALDLKRDIAHEIETVSRQSRLVAQDLAAIRRRVQSKLRRKKSSEP